MAVKNVVGFSAAEILAAVLGSLVLLISISTSAKQYNESSSMNPEHRVKVDKAIAKSRAQSLDDFYSETLISEGETNTGCGELSIGHVDTGGEDQKYGRRPITVDRDIIITGDVINVATGCNSVNDE